jgi:DNA-directed RNA polymerase subunit RPC12/RpoP
MRAISLKCPNCNANLEAGETAHKVTCTYCGTQARVQHRTRFLERKIEMPPAPPAERRMPVAKQRHGFRWVALMSSIFPLIGIGIAVFFTVQQVGGLDRVGDALSDVKDSVTGDKWIYGGKGNALLHDVNEDGKLDVVSTIRYVQRDSSYHLAAFDGVTGTLLWESERFGDHSDANSGLTILHGNAVTQSDIRGNVAAYAVATGERLWKVPVGEKVKEVCADDEVSLAMQL